MSLKKLITSVTETTFAYLYFLPFAIMTTGFKVDLCMCVMESTASSSLDLIKPYSRVSDEVYNAFNIKAKTRKGMMFSRLYNYTNINITHVGLKIEYCHGFSVLLQSWMSTSQVC